MFRNPFRDRRKFKLGWRTSYPAVSLNEPQLNGMEDKFPSNEITTTKYSAFSYLPKVLLQEFKKFTSLYFLIVAIITLIPAVSPFSPWTSVGGLLFILAVSMFREAVEDILRLRADAKVNRATFNTVPPGPPVPLHGLSQGALDLLPVPCAELRVGDLLYLQADEIIPADLLLLSSGEPESACYIETAQLDGETNLKLRRPPRITQELLPTEIASLRGLVQVNGVPDTPLYQFEGSLSLQPQCIRPEFIPPSMLPSTMTNIDSFSSSSPQPQDQQHQDQQPQNQHHQQQSSLSKVQEFDLETQPLLNATTTAAAATSTFQTMSLHDAQQPSDHAATHHLAALQFPLDGSMMLPRGCRLRNTPWVCGMVVFAGTETKLMLNARDPPSKFSSLDYRINKYVLWIFVFQLVLCVWMGGITAFFQHNGASESWYLGQISLVHPAVAGVENFFAYFALMSYLIPISLVVTVEIAKVIQGMFMTWDVEMMTYDEATAAWEGMTVKTFNLNDDLGTIKYIFSDKTGTLTRNQMVFMKCAVLSVDAFHSAATGQVYQRLASAPVHSPAWYQLHRFLLTLSLCHSCVASGGGPLAGEPHTMEEYPPVRYRSASPDEEALCLGAAHNHYVFRGRHGNHSVLEIFGMPQHYQLLFEMPFTSERRRMSCILRQPDGTVLLLSKGADVEMLARLQPGAAKVDFLSQHLDLFSAEGLRTLVLCYRSLTEAELADFSQQYYAASLSVTERDQAIERVNDAIERDLIPLGCTAIEDKLQDQVPESISYLQGAQINIWVITGDKQATAINIGYSSRLLSPSMTLERINVESSQACLQRLEELCLQYLPTGDSSAFEVPQNELALVIDGTSLTFCLHDHPDLLYRLAEISQSVICCRVSPLQKAEVVRLVKTRTTDICLAIGDGANDVGMIQEAHIGIGIFGREGSEAARSSDYALREFKHLKRLLCVHGRYALIRNAGLSLYSLYKNAAIFLSQIWFSFFSVASAQTLYDEWIMTFFNIIFTSWPPLIYGCVEKDIDERIIELYPETYQRTQQNKVFTLWKLTEWMLFATWHSVVLYFGTMALIYWPVTIMNNGQTFGLTTFGNMCMTTGIIVIFLKLIMETLEWNWIVHLSMWGSIALYFILVIMETVWLPPFISQYWVFFNLIQYTPVYWLWFLCAIVLCLLPDFILLMVRTYFYPEDWLLLREHYILNPVAFAALSNPDPFEPLVNIDPSDYHATDHTPLLASSSFNNSSRRTYGSNISPQFEREIPLSPSTPLKPPLRYTILHNSDDESENSE